MEIIKECRDENQKLKSFNTGPLPYSACFGTTGNITDPILGQFSSSTASWDAQEADGFSLGTSRGSATALLIAGSYYNIVTAIFSSQATILFSSQAMALFLSQSVALFQPQTTTLFSSQVKALQ